MRRFFQIAACVFLLANATGCTMIYKTVVDERSVSEIAKDTQIKARILNSYGEDDTMKVLDFFVGVYETDVYLVGAYDTLAQMKRGIEIAKRTEDVKSVSTYLFPADDKHPCTSKVDLDITLLVKGRLIKDTDIWSTNVDVKTVQCNVALVGLVGSATEVEKAVAHAKGVEGVRRVKSFLKTRR